MTRVLVVDDDPWIRQLVTIILGESGDRTVEVARDGEAAVARLSDPSLPAPDLVVLDVMMPGMGGFEVLAWIRDQEWLYDLPVVMLTARTGLDDELSGWHRGCDAYVRKPFEPDELERVVDEVTGISPELRIARRTRRLGELLRRA